MVACDAFFIRPTGPDGKRLYPSVVSRYAEQMRNKRKSPSPSLPRIACDFNSVGWSGDDDDECYYSFDEKALAAQRPRPGMRVFIYEQGRGKLVMGCEARLEKYQRPQSNEVRWRLRPVPNTGYLGGLA